MSQLCGNCFRAVAPSKQVGLVLDSILSAAFVSFQDGTIDLAWRARMFAAEPVKHNAGDSL